jgi:hypothetical protein
MRQNTVVRPFTRLDGFRPHTQVAASEHVVRLDALALLRLRIVRLCVGRVLSRTRILKSDITAFGDGK